MPRLIFFCGHAGTGKTTLARRTIATLMQQAHLRCSGESFCLLDKDTLYGQYSSSVMGVLTGNPNDRDSPLYLQHLRDPEYAGLLDTARDNLDLDCNVFVVGPLSREIREHKLIDRAWLRVPEQTAISIVWVHLQEDEARRRIEKRGNPNDQWKLEHWDQYRTRLFMPEAEEYPELRLYDNTTSDEAQYQQLKRELFDGCD